MSDADSDFLPLFEAVARLSSVADGIAAAKTVVSNALRDGELTASCYLSAFGFDMGKVSLTLPEISKSRFGSAHARQIILHPGQPNVLGPSFWRHSYDWDQDIERWDWQAGLIIVSRPPAIRHPASSQKGLSLEEKIGTRMVAYQVQVRRSQIDALGIPAPNSPLGRLNPRNAPGRKPIAAWHEWVAELVAHVHEFGIPIGHYTAYALIRDVNDALANRGFEGISYGTAQHAAEATIARLREVMSTIPE